MSSTQEKQEHKCHWRGFGQPGGTVVCDECNTAADVNKLIDSAKREAYEHFLKEALEMIGKDDRDYSGDNTDHDSKIFLVAASTACNELRAELRNKFNDRYGE